MGWVGAASSKTVWVSAALAVASAVAGLSLYRLDAGNGRGTSRSADQELAADVQRRYVAMKLLQFPEQPEISVAEWLNRSNERPAVLVDVREPHERRVSMLPGAITKEEFERNSTRYRSWVVVPYCTIGVRSGIYTKTLRDQGFEAQNLAGSALAWAHAGLPFEADGQATRRVHVFNAGWNLLPRGYEPVVSRFLPLPEGHGGN
ncbi:rhodanese-like domain-containing protein [Synechococcus sp. ATX 2A4]|nr:rhodanese-like domain-containing protein [Synechococcus sp. ATX 2A4]